MTGFVYIWFDRKHKRYYIGSHWGSPDDGYICSSRWMKHSYKRRPQDFKRRILSIVTTTRAKLFEIEKRWLSFIAEDELGKRYYNLGKWAGSHWSCDKDRAAIVIEKVAAKKRGKPGTPHTAESRQKISDAKKGVPQSPTHLASLSAVRKGKASPMKGQRFSEDARKNMGGQNRGKTASQETKDKMSAVRKDLRWYTDGVRSCRFHDGDPIPHGFTSGRARKVLG